MTQEITFPIDYIQFISELKSKIRSASIKAAYRVNTEMIQLYFEMGRSLASKIEINKLQNTKFNIVRQSSIDLVKEFGKGYGYSERNLQYMVKFFKNYSEFPELQRLVAVVPWGSNCEILDAKLSITAKQFYLEYSIKTGCTRPVLSAQISTGLFERNNFQTQTNFELTIPENSEQAKELVKDSYLLQTVDPDGIIHERHLENRLIQNIKDFLMELGSDFAYVGNQFHIVLDEESSFIDLLFFNRKLQCLFAIDLKMTEFIPEYIGKMQFYLELLDTQIKLPHENPSIGIILCKSKKRLKVETSLKKSNSPIAVATYELVAKLEKKLPALLDLNNENDI